MGSFFLGGFFAGFTGLFCFEEEEEAEAFGRGMLPRGDSLCLGVVGMGAGSAGGGTF